MYLFVVTHLYTQKNYVSISSGNCSIISAVSVLEQSLLRTCITLDETTDQSPIAKLSTTKLVRKSSLVQQIQILVLRRQNVTASARTGDKTSWHEKF